MLVNTKRRRWFLGCVVFTALCLGFTLYRSNPESDPVSHMAMLVALVGLVIGLAFEMWPRGQKP